MVEYKYSWLVLGILIWPIIVNAQPGTTFVLLGVDWKADNLDNSLFWIGIFFLVMFFIAQVLGEKLDNRGKERKT